MSIQQLRKIILVIPNTMDPAMIARPNNQCGIISNMEFINRVIGKKAPGGKGGLGVEGED